VIFLGAPKTKILEIANTVKKAVGSGHRPAETEGDVRNQPDRPVLISQGRWRHWGVRR